MKKAHCAGQERSGCILYCCIKVEFAIVSLSEDGSPTADEAASTAIKQRCTDLKNRTRHCQNHICFINVLYIVPVWIALRESLFGAHDILHDASASNAASGGCSDEDQLKLIEAAVEARVKEELEKHDQQNSAGHDKQSSSSSSSRFPKSTEKFANGMARIKKDDLVKYYDFGNPMDPGTGTGQEDALIIYQHQNSFPTSDKSIKHSAQYTDGNLPLITDPKVATENCDAMNVIFSENPGNTRQCTVIIGNYESYHIQRWMKVDTTKSTPIKPELPLKLVSRGYASRGKANFYAPPFDGKFSPVKRHWGMLTTFLQNVDSVLEDLKPILAKAADANNAVVILTCNMGQSALLMNFACSARRRGFDLGNVMVFPTDVETKELAERLGLAVYYDEKVSIVAPICFG